MISLDFLSDGQNTILNELYNLTEGNIILSGSSVLKINGVVDRSIGNINLNLNKEDFNYFHKIDTVFKMEYVRDQYFGIKNKTYWFRRNNTVGVLFISDNIDFDVHNINGNELRVGTVKSIRDNKEELVNSGDVNWKKHYNDVQLIDKFYGTKKPNKTLL
jgi:hypothetical protein